MFWKSVLALVVIVVFAGVVVPAVLADGGDTITSTDVITVPTHESPVPLPTVEPEPDEPDEPAPSLSEVLKELVWALGEKATNFLHLAIGAFHVWLVNLIRKRFPDGKGGSRLVGGAAEFTAGLTAFGEALIFALATLAVGAIGSIDFTGVLSLGLGIWAPGFAVHKAYKLRGLVAK